MTEASPRPVLADRYDAVVFDLDGVLYRGDTPIPAAPSVIDRLHANGTPLAFLTNNSSRTARQTADRLAAMGVRAAPEELVTSALVTARMLERDGAAGSSAFVIGEAGVREALASVGIRVLDAHPDRADLVVVGWDRAVDYDALRTASLLVERGARLVATNADASYPAPDGLWPGAGAILAAVTTTTGARATVAGKPARPMFDEAARLTGARHPVVVGDRLDTDVAGAEAIGWDSLLVLTGAATPRDLPRGPALPTSVGSDVGALFAGAPPARFRPAQPSDTEAVAELLVSARLSPEGVPDRILETLVADDPDQGPPAIMATSCLQAVHGFGILRSVAVPAELRGCGLGMLAASASLHRAREQGVGLVALFTETAAGFFASLGFRAVDRATLPEAVVRSRHAAEECPSTATAMVWEA